MKEASLISEGNDFLKKIASENKKQSAIMESIKNNDAMELTEGSLLIKKVNENFSAVKEVLDTFSSSVSDEVYRVVEMTKFKFNTAYNILLDTNGGENVIGEAVIFKSSKPEFLQIITSDLDCINTIVSENLGQYKCDIITEASELGIDKSSSKTSEALVFTFKI